MQHSHQSSMQHSHQSSMQHSHQSSMQHSHHVINAALSTISLHKNKHSRATRLSCTTHAQPTMGARQTECGQHQASGHHTFRRKPMMQLPTSKK
jgi:hypothetical protein